MMLAFSAGEATGCSGELGGQNLESKMFLILNCSSELWNAGTWNEEQVWKHPQIFSSPDT